MKTITFKSTKYVLLDDVMRNAPIYAKGSRNTRTLIKKKKIPDTDYLYAKLNENKKWSIVDGKSIKFDKLFVKKDYLINIPELNDDEEKIIDNKGIEKAPDIINLKDEEKFMDDEGNVLEIETRGSRNCNDVYFKVKDIAEKFGIKQLYTTIIANRNENTYKSNIDYKYFNCKISY